MPVSKTVSMTGFAARRGQGAGHSWAWDIRSVNGKGLDLRLRVPDWIDGLEQALRAELAKAMGRGNVSLSLKVARDGMSEGAEGLRVNPPALAAVLKAMSSEGRGTAWLPKSHLTKEFSEGTLVPAGDERWHIPVEVRLIRSRDPLPDVSEELWALLPVEEDTDWG